MEPYTEAGAQKKSKRNEEVNRLRLDPTALLGFKHNSGYMPTKQSVDLRHSTIFHNVSVLRLLELLDHLQDVGLDEELEVDGLEANLLNAFLEGLVIEYHVVAVPVDEQDAFVFDFGMASRNTAQLQEVTLWRSCFL